MANMHWKYQLANGICALKLVLGRLEVANLVWAIAEHRQNIGAVSAVSALLKITCQQGQRASLWHPD